MRLLSWILSRFRPQIQPESPKLTIETPTPELIKLVSKYAGVLGRWGPDSCQVQQFRKSHATNAAFLEYADSLDRMKRRLSPYENPFDFPGEEYDHC